uniref:Uncharacterized protein n=1 Tax=Spongospora subterranea TaxID=70186 RepID=A0A0H5QT48_9EUKA|eukprot:CRZ05125.1 hypothetical protein [Spongospora subterranea]
MACDAALACGTADNLLRLPTEKKWIMSTKTMEQETISAWQIQSCKAYSLTGFSTLLMSFLCKRSSEEGHNFFISIFHSSRRTHETGEDYISAVSYSEVHSI